MVVLYSIRQLIGIQTNGKLMKRNKNKNKKSQVKKPVIVEAVQIVGTVFSKYGA